MSLVIQLIGSLLFHNNPFLKFVVLFLFSLSPLEAFNPNLGWNSHTSFQLSFPSSRRRRRSFSQLAFVTTTTSIPSGWYPWNKRSFFQQSPVSSMAMTTIDKTSSSSLVEGEDDETNYKDLFRVRTVTCFLGLSAQDFANDGISSSSISSKIEKAATLIQQVQQILIEEGEYEVQTTRIATNPFGEWLYSSSSRQEEGEEEESKDDTTAAVVSIAKERLTILNNLLEEHEISFCSLGPAKDGYETVTFCPMIVGSGLSCSAMVHANNENAARAAASVIQQIPWDQNFRFCTASYCQPYIPFFPGAKADNAHDFSFALGLENGSLVHHLFSSSSKKVQNLSDIDTVFQSEMNRALLPLQQLCITHFSKYYKGIDTSLNPSLDGLHGSVAHALEQLPEIQTFGQSGTLAAAAAITQALQSLPDIQRTGYCGLMLPVCEDVRLAQLASSTYGRKQLSVTQLLNISSVCGVGVDTVPLAGDVSTDTLTSLILDVAALAGRWNKSLSCRVFPVENAKVGDVTPFDESPYLCNSEIFDLQ